MNRETFINVLIIILVLFMSSCTNDERQLENHLNKLNSLGISRIDLNGWIIKHHNENSEMINYTLYKKDVDTIINIAFIYFKKSNDYEVENYSKFYQDTIEGYYYSLQLFYDTLYFYRQLDLSSPAKDFIVGKYYYQYKYNQLTHLQEKYFERNIDSLKRIRGNNLLDLPGEK